MKTTRFLVSAAALAALVFTFSACSSDSEDKATVLGACDMGEDSMGISMCLEVNSTGNMKLNEIKDMCEDEWEMDGKWQNSCDGGAYLECSDMRHPDFSGAIGTAHIYVPDDVLNALPAAMKDMIDCDYIRNMFGD